MELRFFSGRTNKEKFVIRHDIPLAAEDTEFINEEVYQVDSLAIEVGDKTWEKPTEITSAQRDVKYGHKTYTATEYTVTPPNQELIDLEVGRHDAVIVINGELVKEITIVVE